MNRCPNCAAQNRDGAKFCTSCGFRLPAETPPIVTSDRSPFATTASAPSLPNNPAPGSDNSPNGGAAEAQGFATWGSEAIPGPEPGKSWDARPPVDTAVPVSDEMIASLVEGTVPPVDESEDVAAMPATNTVHSSGGTTVDELLRLARELEYGLIELAEAPMSPGAVDGNPNLLRNALGDLQDEDELGPLRSAVSTAQERPRDVDVMLDLVLRADSIASLLTERDQLKAAIALFLASAPAAEESPQKSDEGDTGDDAAETVDLIDEMVPGEVQPSI